MRRNRKVLRIEVGRFSGSKGGEAVGKDLIVYAALFVSSIIVGNFLWSFLQNRRLQRIQQTAAGLVYGIAGGFLLYCGWPFGSLESYHLAPIAVNGLLGFPQGALLSAAVTALAGFLFTPEDLAPSAAAAMAGIGIACAVPLAQRRRVHWAALAGLVFIAQLIAAIWDEGGTLSEQIWREGAVSAVWTVAMLFGAERMIATELSRSKLVSENTYLTQHDLLTGLLNFQTFQARLHNLLMEGDNRVCFILVDCDDLKSLNTEQGYHTVDSTLKHVANLLRAYFPEALLMGRYGSDEFAIVIPYREHLDVSLEDILESRIPEIADIRFSYGYAVYPDEERDPGLFLALTQQRVLETKRRLWLEREAHWLHNERLMAVGELAAGMAHEIRNPLTTVKGFLQVSKQNGYNIAEYYDIIMHEIKRMSDLTAEFLQFSKPSKHQPSLITIQECVQAAVQLTESEIARNGFQLVRTQEEQPLYSFLEKDKIVQVLVNIIRNGMEAMEEGSGTLSINVFTRGEFGIIEVTDTGVGMKEEQLLRLFQPFYSTKPKGTGLGLSISQKIINEHGGYISVRSRPGAGSTFTIRLPLAERE